MAEIFTFPRNDIDVSKSSGRPITFGWTSTGRHIVVAWEVANEDPRMIYVRTAYETPAQRKKR